MSLSGHKKASVTKKLPSIDAEFSKWYIIYSMIVRQ